MYGVKREELAVEGEKNYQDCTLKIQNYNIYNKNHVCIYEEYKKKK